MIVVITASREVLKRQPGRYAHRALQPRTDYSCDVFGHAIRGHNNLSTLKDLVRKYARREGVTEPIIFEIRNV